MLAENNISALTEEQVILLLYFKVNIIKLILINSFPSAVYTGEKKLEDYVLLTKLY